MRAALAALAVVWLGSASGCGKPVLRIADASLGDYYTDAEFKKLSKEQRDEYCLELARQDSIYVAEIAETREILSEIEARRGSLTAEADSLTKLAEDLLVRRPRAEPGAGGRGEARDGGEAADGGPWTSYAVKPGDSLWRISAAARGYGDGSLWRRIFEANRQAVRDPNLIHPGQELKIPR